MCGAISCDGEVFTIAGFLNHGCRIATNEHWPAFFEQVMVVELKGMWRSFNAAFVVGNLAIIFTSIIYGSQLEGSNGQGSKLDIA